MASNKYAVHLQLFGQDASRRVVVLKPYLLSTATAPNHPRLEGVDFSCSSRTSSIVAHDQALRWIDRATRRPALESSEDVSLSCKILL